MKFSHKLAFAVGGLILSSLSILSYIQYTKTEHGFKIQIYADTHEITKSIAENLNNKMLNLKKTFDLVIHDLQGDFTKERVADTLKNPILKEDFALVGMAFSSDGLPVSNSDSGFDKISKDSGYDARQQGWYNTTLRDGKLGYTKPTIDKLTKKLLITMSAPSTDNNGTDQGVFFANIELEFLAEIINSVDVANGAGRMFIVDDNGLIIAHPNMQYVGKSATTLVPGLQIKAGEIQRFNFNDHNMLYSFTPLKNMPWFIVAAIDEKKAFSSVVEIGEESIIFTIVALFLCIISLIILIRVLFKPLNTLNIAIQSLAKGDADLTQRLDTNTDKEFAELADGFNLFIAMLQRQIDETKKSSVQIRKISQQTIQSGKQATMAVSTQQQELDQLATAMNEMSSSAQDVAGNAQEASSTTENARKAAMQGTEIVNENAAISQHLADKICKAGELVYQLEQSSNDIESILDVITQISEQTNLLALNAAIEAARAGDFGRGFSVVADEVRTLAQKTQQSTTEIRSKIEHLQSASKLVVSIMDESKNDVKESVNVAKQSNDELQVVFNAITSATDLVIQIASAAEQQHCVSEEINVNTNNIRELAITVLKSIKDTTEQSNQQDKLVILQEKLLERFKV